MKVERYTHQLQRRCGKCGRTTVGKHFLIESNSILCSRCYREMQQTKEQLSKENFIKEMCSQSGWGGSLEAIKKILKT